MTKKKVAPTDKNALVADFLKQEGEPQKPNFGIKFRFIFELIKAKPALCFSVIAWNGLAIYGLISVIKNVLSLF